MAKKTPAKKIKKTAKQKARKPSVKSPQRATKNIKKAVKKSGTVPAQKIIESDSRSVLKRILSPWICTGTGGEGIDIGHDFYVEIVSEADFNVFDADGRHFLMQLKAQSKLPKKDGFVTPKSIETKKIKQWYQNSLQLPYLFVVNDYPSNKFYFQWIDGQFMSNLEKDYPYWTTEDYLTIKIPERNCISAETKSAIREYVLNKRVQDGKLIEPGIYFHLKAKTEKLIAKYQTIVSPLKFHSVDNNIAELKEKTENATYRLAMTGLSRVGKSTLINTVLKRKDASPVDVNQTTGVPIQFHPSKDETVTIYYLDGRNPQTFPYSHDIIKEYATRDFNEDNHKKVSFVLVGMASSQLEKGVMLYDIPGLNDPNPKILNYAYHTANCANAIIYVIDCTSALSGGFVFDDRYRKHIENFSSKDKIFLVVNKVDKLKKDQLANLKKEIARNLDKYNLRDKINDKIYYLSVDPKEDDLKNLAELQGEYLTFEDLENDLWQFILNGDKVGLFKLYTVLKDFEKSLSELGDILHVTHLNSKSKKQLEEAIRSTREKIPRLGEYIHNQRSMIVRNLRVNINARKIASLKNLERSLRDIIRLSDDLPSDGAIKDYAIKESYRIMSLTENDFGLELNHLKSYIANWMQDNLKEVKVILKKDSPSLEYDPTAFGNVVMPKLDFSMTWGAGILGFIVGTILAPEVGLLIGIGSAIANLILGKEYRQEKKIRGIIKQIEKVYANFFDDVKFKIDGIVQDELNKLVPYVNEKLNLYFTDITNEIARLNLAKGVDYLALYESTKSEMQNIRKEYADLMEELHPYLVAIRPNS